MSTPNETVGKLVRLPSALAEQLREEAHSSRRTQTEIIVRSLETYLEALERRRARTGWAAVEK